MKILSNYSNCQSLRGTNVATGSIFTNVNNVKFMLGGEFQFSVSSYPGIPDGYKITFNTDYGRYYDVGDQVLISFVTNSNGYSYFVGNIQFILSPNEFIIQSIGLTGLITGGHISYNLQYEGQISCSNVGNIISHIYLKTSLYATDKTSLSSVTLNTTRFYSPVVDALTNSVETTASSPRAATLISTDFDRYSNPVFIGIEIIPGNSFYDTVTSTFANHYVVNCSFGHNYNKLYFMTQSIENTHYGPNYPNVRQYAHLAIPIEIETPELEGIDTYKFFYEFEFSRYNNNSDEEHIIRYSKETTLNSTPYFNEKFNSQSPDYELEIVNEDVNFDIPGYTNRIDVQLVNVKIPINLLVYDKDYITFIEKKEQWNKFVDTFEGLRIISKCRDSFPALNNHFSDFYNNVTTPVVQSINFFPTGPTSFTINFQFNPLLWSSSLGTHAIEGLKLFYVNEALRDIYINFNIPNADNALQSHLIYNKSNATYLENLNSKKLHFTSPIMYWNSRKMCNNVQQIGLSYQFSYGTHSNTAPLFANAHLFRMRCFKTLKDGITPVDDNLVKFKQLRIVWVKGDSEFFTNPIAHPLVNTRPLAYFYNKQYLDELVDNFPIMFETNYDILSITGGTGITYQGLPQHPDTEIKRYNEISDANAPLIPNYEYRFGRDSVWIGYVPTDPAVSEMVYFFTSTFYERENESVKNIPNRLSFLDFSEDHAGHNHSHPHYQKYPSSIVNDYQISDNAKKNLVFPVIIVSYDYDGIPQTESLTPLHFTTGEFDEFNLSLQNCFPACVYHDKLTGGIYDYFVVGRYSISALPDGDPQLQFATSLGTYFSNPIALEGDTINIKTTNPAYNANILTPIPGFLYTKLTPTILGMTLIRAGNDRDITNRTCFEFAPVANQFVQDSDGIDIVNPYRIYEIKNIEEGEYFLYVYIGKTYYQPGDIPRDTSAFLIGNSSYEITNPIFLTYLGFQPPTFGIMDIATMRIPIKVVKTIDNTPPRNEDDCCQANYLEKYINVTTDGSSIHTLDDTVLLFLDKTLDLNYNLDVGGLVVPMTILNTVLSNYILYNTGNTVTNQLYAIPLSVLMGTYYNNPSFPCVIININGNAEILVYNEIKKVASLAKLDNTISSNSFLNYKSFRMFGQAGAKQRITFIDFFQKDDEGNITNNKEQIQLNRVSELYNYNKVIQKQIALTIPNFNVVYNYIDIIALMQDTIKLELEGNTKYGKGSYHVSLDTFNTSHYGNSSFGDLELNFNEKYNTFIS